MRLILPPCTVNYGKVCVSLRLAQRDDAWLVLDRNQNGKIDNGVELFGNMTPQPAPPEGEVRNGFLALAEFDKSANGGNGDGVISAQDLVWQNLKFWKDLDHNGVTSAGELLTVGSQAVKSIVLKYNIGQHTDVHGNLFRYVSVVVMNDMTPRRCVDVYPAWVE